jgi:penicillin-binding protein 1B
MTEKSSDSSNTRDKNDRGNRPRKQRPSLFKGLGMLLGLILLSGVILAVITGGAYILNLDSQIRSKFEGQRWALPAHVYARPLELFQGMTFSGDQFANELQWLRYRDMSQPHGPGTFSRNDETFEVITRGFDFWDGPETSQRIRISFEDGKLKELTSLEGQSELRLLRMEPIRIAGIYPAHNEDRLLVQREDLPPILADAILAVEDRSFYRHLGVDLKGIFRAFLANVEAGRTVQGGSTLTQQLVKNYFLTSERTLNRKINEALMALLVEWHYDKDEILEVYCNEVYLGQDGDRAIHGFGLASQFFFGRPLGELNLHHVALLVGLIRGPSYYDPRRYPERAKARRALMLDLMTDQGLISAEDAAIAKEQSLGVLSKPPSGVTRYPAFVDLVRRQLREIYREEDLTSEGLMVFTTLDPQVQEVAEQAVIQGLPVLEKSSGKAKDLQSATIVADTQNGEVRAIVGGRDVRLAGFNRALDARRQPGSVIKPAVYLTALEDPENYTLATRLNDAKPLVVYAGGERWSPKNYDKRYHGRVMLQDSLARSYNVSTARLGMELEIENVVDTLHRLGIKSRLPAFPSLVLGAADLPPLEIAQMYASLASGGYRIPLRSIREVTTADGQPLQRYPLQFEKATEPGPGYLITKAMQRVVERGTATAIRKAMPDMHIAGKTGTTDDYRDSWFAGFSGNLMSVVWVGRDDNRSTGLSGSTGALRIWLRMMKNLPLTPLEPMPPEEIEEILIDPYSGLRASSRCRSGQKMPFLVGSAPRWSGSCGGGGSRKSNRSKRGSYAKKQQPFFEFKTTPKQVVAPKSAPPARKQPARSANPGNSTRGFTNK